MKKLYTKYKNKKLSSKNRDFYYILLIKKIYLFIEITTD